jgi:hypothetical protein
MHIQSRKYERVEEASNIGVGRILRYMHAHARVRGTYLMLICRLTPDLDVVCKKYKALLICYSL